MLPPWVWTFIENLVANWTAELFGPNTMIAWLITLVIVVVVAIRWHRQQRAAKNPGMASWQFIALCFVVALVAIGGGAFGLGLRFSNQPVVDAAPPAPTSGQTAQPQQKPQRKFSAADVPKLTPILQKISETLTSEGAPLSFEIYNFCITLQQKLNDLGTQETIRQLQAFADRANKFGGEIDDIQNGAGYYQNEVNYIIHAKSGNMAQTVAAEMKNSTRWMNGIVTPMNQASFEILGHMDFPLQSRAKDFQKWATDVPKRIQEIRDDLDAVK